MRTLEHLARRVSKAESGTYLAPVFRAMEERGMRARMGTATFVVGPPGSLKTAFMLYYALAQAARGRSLLYFSADSEEFEIVERAAAIVTGTPMGEVSKDHAAFADALGSLGKVRFCFDSAPTYSDLEMEIAAFAEVEGRFADIIVIDTLMKVVGETDDEWAAMRDTAQVVHEVTRRTGAAVFVVHHASDDRIDPSTPAARNKTQGRVTQLPKEIWGPAVSGDEFRICPLKSKITREDPTGRDYVTLYVDPSTGRFFNSRYDMQNGRAA